MNKVALKRNNWKLVLFEGVRSSGRSGKLLNSLGFGSGVFLFDRGHKRFTLCLEKDNNVCDWPRTGARNLIFLRIIQFTFDSALFIPALNCLECAFEIMDMCSVHFAGVPRVSLNLVPLRLGNRNRFSLKYTDSQTAKFRTIPSFN